MSNKLTFKEWFFQCGFHKDGYDCNQVSSSNSAWNFCQAQEQKEISELKKKVEELEKSNLKFNAQNTGLLSKCSAMGKENDSLWVENEDLTRKVEELEKDNNSILSFCTDLQMFVKDIFLDKDKILAFQQIRQMAYKHAKDRTGKIPEWGDPDVYMRDHYEKIESTENVIMGQVEELKKELEKAEEVIEFYANQENWYSHGKDSTIKRWIDLNDGEEFLNYEHGGKRARAYLKESV